MEIVCPNCKKPIDLDTLASEKIKCPHCGEPIDYQTSDSESYFDMQKQGLSFLNKQQFDKLLDLSKAMLKIWKNDFYSYLFYVCSLANINLLDDLIYPEYKLSEEEIQDDLKARLYHLARIKYSKSSQVVYSKISSYYPDLAIQDGWRRAITSYDRKYDVIEAYNNKLNEIDKNLNKLNDLAINKKEKQIVDKIFKWKTYLAKAKDELKRYDEYASNLVNKDFNNTPKVGNSTFANLYILLFVFSVVLFFYTLSNLIYGHFVGFSNIFAQTSSIINAVYSLAMVVFFTVKLNLFSKGRHPLLGAGLYVFYIVISLLGIFACFANFNNSSNLIMVYFIIILISLVYVITTSIIKFKKYYSFSLRKSNTYLSNIKALAKNNFKVNNEFVFKDIRKAKSDV